MNKNLLLIGGGLLALLAISKPAGATTARGMGLGNNGSGLSTWANRSRNYNNAMQRQASQASANQGIGQVLGLASLAKSLGLGDTFSSIGQSISGAIDAATGVTMPSYYSGVGDLFTSGLAEDATLGSVTIPTDIFASGIAEDAAATAAADSMIAAAPWIAGAALVDSKVFNGQVGQTVVNETNNLVSSVGDVLDGAWGSINGLF